jgi:hypothetical protein
MQPCGAEWCLWSRPVRRSDPEVENEWKNGVGRSLEGSLHDSSSTAVSVPHGRHGVSLPDKIGGGTLQWHLSDYATTWGALQPG